MARRAGWTPLTTIIVTLAAGACFGQSPATSGADVRRALHAILDRPKVGLDPQTRPMPDRDGLSVEHLTFVSEPGQVVPALILKDKSLAGPLPVAIVLHGTGASKEQNLDLLVTLARRGFLAVAPDGRYHGERCKAGQGTVEYYAAIAQAYQDGRSHPWLFDTAYDVTRLIDYLQTRGDVDATRIGLMGISKGGMETYITAAADPRVAVVVPCISVQGFKWELDHDAWHERINTVKGGFEAAAKAEGAAPDVAFVRKFYDRLVPGIDGVLDCPSLVPTICPRPLLTINGEKDGLNPLPGWKIAVDATAAAYAAAGCPDKFKAEVEPGVGHAVTPPYKAEAIEWFVRWLKPTAKP